jgi:hypothetical protein
VPPLSSLDDPPPQPAARTITAAVAARATSLRRLTSVPFLSERGTIPEIPEGA